MPSLSQAVPWGLFGQVVVAEVNRSSRSVAEAVGAAGAAVFVGALVVHPEAISRTDAAASASGDFHVVFNPSMPIYF
jgi:hypothetical protein